MRGTPSIIPIALAIVLLHTVGTVSAEILDADTLEMGTYRSACFSVW